MPLTPQVETLIGRLLDLSRGGKVAWQSTADEDSYLASVAKFIVTITELGRYEPQYRLTIADQSDTVLEDATISQEESRYEECRELYDAARRSALHVDARLSEFLSSLDAIR